MVKFIDSLPLESDIIEKSQLSVRDNSIYLKHLRFSHKCVSTLERVANLQSFLKKEAVDDRGIAYLLESYILSILYSNSITNPSRTYRSPHYLRRMDVITAMKPSVPEFYLEEMALSNLRTWGGNYGMPTYCLHLQGDTRHYLPTMDIGDTTIKYYLSRLSFNSNWVSLSNLDYLEDGELMDEGLYNLSHQIITDDSSILQCYLVYKFLSSFIPKVLLFYEENYESIEDQYLLSICHALINLGVEKDVGKLHYLYMHQALPNQWVELFPLIINMRKRAPSVDSNTSELVMEFMDKISITTEPDLYQTSSNTILSYMCPPGGFNLYLMILSTALLIRAHCIYRESQEYNSRVNNLIYYSSLCLRKTNLGHLQKIGNNLLFLSRRAATDSTDLLS